MEALQAFLLGIIQGLTEWLPVSSSGHLVVAQELLDLDAEEQLVFDLIVHLGTILAVVVFFRKELARIVASFLTSAGDMDAERRDLRRLGLLLLLATVPVALAGLLIGDKMEEIFDIDYVGFAFVLNACILFVASRLWSSGMKRSAGTADAVVIGLFQAVSVVPGISRSGSTISGGMARGLEKETSAVFAFLLSVPALLGAFAYGVATLDTYDTDLLSAAIGFATAFGVGLMSIKYLLKAVKAGKLWWFGAYTLLLGLAIIILTL
ncbi:MAG: undecaprenyl-diphosphate phosphatase [Thermoplasmata archaeon]|jgi:undecaprenyl-diphosphatase|nr:undecaprenyl-diphosphate phosphatase [Thermoplasmata archaeon]